MYLFFCYDAATIGHFKFEIISNRAEKQRLRVAVGLGLDVAAAGAAHLCGGEPAVLLFCQGGVEPIVWHLHLRLRPERSLFFWVTIRTRSVFNFELPSEPF